MKTRKTKSTAKPKSVKPKKVTVKKARVSTTIQIDAKHVAILKKLSKVLGIKSRSEAIRHCIENCA